MSTPTAVLVHGAWHGPWVWDDVRRHLDAAGIPSATVALPSVGDRLGGLADDVAAVSAVLDELTGPFVLIGHSYGGVPITEVAASRRDVTHAVYVCAFAVPVGTSLLDAVGGEPPDWWIVAEDGTSILPEDPRAVFFAECAPEVADEAAAKLHPHSMASVREPLRAAAYGRLPATYVVCERDARFPVDAQRACAELAGATTVTLDTDHSPMLSLPTELAGLLTEVVASAADPQ